MGFTDRIMVIVDAASSGAVKELEGLQREAKKTDSSFDTLGKKFGVTGQTLKAGLVAGAAALVGTGLVSFLGDSAEAFGDSAKAAGELAAATGGTVDEVSRMQAALKGAGIEAGTAGELMTKFAVNAGKNKGLLNDIGVVLKTGADGSVDYADAMVQAVDGINRMGDASQRNQALVKLFGRTGAVAFQELAASGISLSQSMALVSKYQVFTADDVRRAQAYDDAMDNLGAAVQGVQFTLGRTLVPLLSEAADGFGAVLGAVSPVIEVLGGIPGEVWLVVGSVVALNTALKSQLVAEGLSSAATALVGMQSYWDTTATKMQNVKAAAAGLGGGLAAVGKAVGPLLLVAGGIAAVTSAMRSAKDVQEFVSNVDNVTMSLEDQAKALEADEDWWNRFVGTTGTKMQQIALETRQKAEASLESAEATEAERAAAQALLDVLGEGTIEQQTNNLATEEGNRAQQEYARALGASSAAAQAAQESQRDLADIVADTGASQGELAGAVAEAAEAQAEQNRITSTSKGLMEAYASNTWDAVNATLALFDKQFAARDAQRKYNEQLGGWGKAMEEAGGSADKQGAVLDDLAESALDAAAALAEQDRQTALNNGNFLTAAEVTAKQVEHLKALRDQAVNAGMPQPVIDSLDSYISSLETAQAAASDGITVQTDINLMSPDQVAGKVAELKQRVRDAAQAGNWGLVESLEAEIARVTADQTVHVDTETTYSPGGYDAVKSRKDYLAANVTGAVDIGVTFTPDGFNALKARKDYLAQNRTAYIDVVLRGVEGARRSLDGLRASAAANQQAAGTFSPLNLVRVSIDGQQLRAVVRDEVRRVTPEPAGVA